MNDAEHEYMNKGPPNYRTGYASERNPIELAEKHFRFLSAWQIERSLDE